MESKHWEDATLDTNEAPEAVSRLGSDEGQSAKDLHPRDLMHFKDTQVELSSQILIAKTCDVCDVIVIFR
jgi:hypothetical protein